MKKLLYIPLILGLMWSCDPLEETYDNLDEAQGPYKESIEYTLVSTDYTNASKAALKLAENAADTAKANLIKSQQAFNSRFTANALVGGILSTNFLALNQGSSAVVTYNNNLEDLEYLNAISGATTYTVSNDDYTAVGGNVATAGYFIPSNTADENVASILASAIANAEDGDYAIVSYKQSDNEPGSGGGEVVSFTGYLEDFNDVTEANLEINMAYTDWTSDVVAGDKYWLTKNYNSNSYIQASAYGTTAETNEMWAISPEVNLTGAISPVLSFDVCFGYVVDDVVTVWITTNYTGDASTTTWTELTSNFDFSVGMPAGSGYGVLTNCGTASLSAYVDQTVQIGFKYSGSSTNTTTAQIDNVSIQNTAKGGEKADLFKTYNDVYQYTGTAWKKSSDVRAIHQFEYVAMGQNYGNFSSSAPAANYLPTFLASAYPFAQEGDSKIVAYKYYASGATSYRADKYDFVNGAWTLYSGIVEQSDQFVHTGAEWIFDPTVKFSLTADDMMLLVNWVYSNLSPDYGSSYGNDEFYFGASAYYVNFDLRLSNKVTYNIPGFDGLTEEEGVALTWDRLEEGLGIILGEKFPEAVSTLTGDIPVYYWVTFATYENTLAKNTYTGVFQYSESDAAFVRQIEVEDTEVSNGNLTQAAVNWNR